jgi:DDE family transposase
MAASSLHSGTRIRRAACRWRRSCARPPKGSEVRTVIRHVSKRLRRHWPKARIVWRGDSHYGRVEPMEWAEDHDADYIFGLAGNAALDALVAERCQSVLPSCDGQ